MIGPETPYAQYLHETKYRAEGETFDDYCVRYASSTSDNPSHFRDLLEALREQRLLPAGRQQLAVGRPFNITAMNCYVGDTIEDSSEGIFEELKQSMLTLRSGGGCGWDFSTIRPHGDPIRGLGIKAYATGPVSFMSCWDAMCQTVLCAGHRRGAMMGVLRIDHPDILRFINAKAEPGHLTNFNLSVAITDSFMEALSTGKTYDLMFEGRKYAEVDATEIWSRIMERNWDWAEPGVLFMDTINRMNPLGYCETIKATNPCAEQCLPPHGACLLGSLNLPKYLKKTPKRKATSTIGNITDLYEWGIDYTLMERDIVQALRAFDNVIDSTKYPLPTQEKEAKSKRRMGLGVTGMANTLEIMGHPYGTPSYINEQSTILSFIRDISYLTSIEIGKEKGQFPLMDAVQWLKSGFGRTLPQEIRKEIRKHGLRNGLLLSIAPTGTISLCADNISSGIEPPFDLSVQRQYNDGEEKKTVHLEDWAFANHGVKGKTAQNTTPQEHIEVLCSAQKYIDSSVSKTCNVKGEMGGKKQNGSISFKDFQSLYRNAYENGAKGCTTFNITGKRAGVFLQKEEEKETEAACFIDPETGTRTCDA